MTLTADPAPDPALVVDLAPAHAALSRQRERARRGLWIEGAGLLGLLLLAFALPSFLTDRLLRLEWAYRAALLASFVFIAVRTLARRVIAPLGVELTDEEMALAVERRSPEMRQALISSLAFERSLRDAKAGPESPALMAAVVEDVRTRVAAIPFDRAIEAQRVRRHVGALAATVVVFAGWLAVDAGSLGLWARRNLLLGSVEWPRHTALEFAEADGVVRLAQGDGLTVRVRSRGVVPDQVFLDYRFASGEEGADPMSRSGDDEFTLTIDAIVEDVELRASGGDAMPVSLRVQVVERPRLDDLALRIEFPAYMERGPEHVPATQGELRLPRGAVLHVAGRSHKPIADAFVLLGDDRRVALDRAADGFAFAGQFAPEASGSLTVDVVDQDRLGSGAPPRFLLRVGDDRPPTITFKLRGISSMVTTHARLPGQLLVRDDFGLRQVSAEMKVVADAAGQAIAAEPQPADVPFERVETVFGAALERSALRYETAATVDLAQWNPVPDEDGSANRIRPGCLLSLRYGAVDNFGPGDPHTGYGETMTFRVVTREKMLEELRRRQVEQRRELQGIVDEEKQALLELRENVSPQAAGDRRARVEARLDVLARQQQALGGRVAFVGENYQRILWEYENNNLIDPSKVRQLERVITEPLAVVAKESFPASSRLVKAFRASGTDEAKASAVEAYEEIVRRLQAVLEKMEESETLAALLEELRIVIKMEDSAIQQVENRVRAAEQELFGPGKSDQPDKDKK